MTQVLEQLQDVFRTVFQDDDIALSDSTTAQDIDGWDSLAHIKLIIAIEKQFKIRLATAEISDTKSDGSNVGTLAKLVEKKLAKK